VEVRELVERSLLLSSVDLDWGGHRRAVSMICGCSI